MSKVAVVYWSGTGNTEAMANAVAEGARSAGAAAELFTPSSFNASMAGAYDALAWGCSAQGGEQLEEYEFEPLFEACEDTLMNKKVALFGSYGWGDGEWMRSWESRCTDAGITLDGESVICCEAPDEETLKKCRALGEKLAG